VSAPATAPGTPETAAGREVIDLKLGDPALPTPEPVIEAAYRAMSAGETRYTPTAGTPALRAAVAEKFRQDGLDCTADDVLVGSGAKATLFSILLGDSLDGREVLIPAPHYAAYTSIVRLTGGFPRVIPTDPVDGYKLTPELLAAHLSPATRWLLLNSPSNPTGATYTRDEIAALGEVLRPFPDVLVLSDEIYEQFAYAGPVTSVAPVSEDLARRTVTLNGVSKSYSMTGWRIGYATGPRAVIDAAIAVQFSIVTCASSIGQAAALAALTMDQEPIRARNARFVEHRDLAVEILRDSEHLTVPVPDGAFYLFPAVHRPDGAPIPGLTDQRLVAHLADTADVLVTPGSAFGAPGHFRMNFALDRATVAEACRRIVPALAELDEEGPSA
jgi:aspartate aminotransferase